MDKAGKRASVTHLGNGLWLVCLFGGVGGQSLLLELLCLLVYLVVIGSEKVDIVVILSSGGSGCSLGRSSRGSRAASNELLGRFARGASGKGTLLGREGCDVVVPPQSVRVLCEGRVGERLEHGDICLGWGVSADTKRQGRA